MELGEEIVLRPRFKLELQCSEVAIIEAFKKAKESTKEFIVTQVDHHIFIKIPLQKQHFWSPNWI